MLTRCVYVATIIREENTMAHSSEPRRENTLVKQLAILASRLLGNFERPLIEAVDALGERAYCAELTTHLSQKLGREVSMGQTTRTLKALTEMGLLTAEAHHPTLNGVRQRARSVYKLTEAGRHVFLTAHEFKVPAHQQLAATARAAESPN